MNSKGQITITGVFGLLMMLIAFNFFTILYGEFYPLLNNSVSGLSYASTTLLMIQLLPLVVIILIFMSAFLMVQYRSRAYE